MHVEVARGISKIMNTWHGRIGWLSNSFWVFSWVVQSGFSLVEWPALSWGWGQIILQNNFEPHLTTTKNENGKKFKEGEEEVSTSSVLLLGGSWCLYSSFFSLIPHHSAAGAEICGKTQILLARAPNAECAANKRKTMTHATGEQCGTAAQSLATAIHITIPYHAFKSAYGHSGSTPSLQQKMEHSPKYSNCTYNT